MSLIVSAAAAVVSPIVDFLVHGHHKGGHAASGTPSSAAGATQGVDSTQGLFGSLLQSLEEVAGIPPNTAATAPGTAGSAPHAANAANAAASAASSMANARAGQYGGLPPSSLGAKINATV